MPRSPGAAKAAGGLALAAAAPSRLPALPEWAQDAPGGPSGELRVSLRLELPSLDEDHVRAVVQVRSVADSALVADAEELWHDAQHPLGPRARVDVMLALRKAARVWAPLVRLLHAAVPAGLALSDEELEELLEGAATRLAGAGVEVLWPRGLARDVTAKAVLQEQEPAGSLRSFFGGGQVLRFDWQLALGGTPLDAGGAGPPGRGAPADRPAARPVGDRRPRDGPQGAGAATCEPLTAIDALAPLSPAPPRSAASGSRSRPAGWLDELRERIAEPDAGASPSCSRPRLRATLRDYQLRGLRLAGAHDRARPRRLPRRRHGPRQDDQLIALHLHRQATRRRRPDARGLPGVAARQLGARDQRFAPGVPVRATTAPRARSTAPRTASCSPPTARCALDAERLAAAARGAWSSRTRRSTSRTRSRGPRGRCGRIPAPARVALTGTPVENNLSELWAILDWTTPGPARHRSRRSAPLGRADRGDGDAEAAERLAKLVRPVPAAPPQVRSGHRAGAAAEDRDRPARRR